MIKIQKNKAYSQVLEILNHIKLEDYYKLPKEIIKALEVNKDDDTKFKYDKEKDFLEQEMLSETKLILAIFFKRYWATEDQKAKIRTYEVNKIVAIEEEKKKIYPQNVITDKIVEEKLEEKRQTQLALLNKKNWFKNIISKIKEKFMARSRT